MNVMVNGERQELDVRSVAELLDSLGMGRGRPGCAVAVNGEVVRRGDWDQAALRDGDQVEVLTAVQGG